MIVARCPVFHRLCLLAVSLALLVAGIGPVRLASPDDVLAADPVGLRFQVTDDVGALTDEQRTELARALQYTAFESGVRVWAWFADTFDGQDPADFAAATARKTTLGSTDLLLVLATGDRVLGYWRPDEFVLPDEQLEKLLEPVRAGLEAGATGDASLVELGYSLQNLLDAARPTPPPAPTRAPTTTTTPARETGPSLVRPMPRRRAAAAAGERFDGDR